MISFGIVIPTYNSAKYLREAIDSVLKQNYPSFKCFVADGGSKDDSIEILKSYGNAIEFVSESDSGQADAIQKGFSYLSDCDLLGWLNADDRLLPDALNHIARATEENPGAVLYHGNVELVDAHGRLLDAVSSVDIDYEKLRSGKGHVVQPGSFYRSEALHECGGVNKDFYFTMDHDLWIRLLKFGPACRINALLAQFRIHHASKTSQLPYKYYRDTLKLAYIYEKERLLFSIPRTLNFISKDIIKWVLKRRINFYPQPPPPGNPPRIFIDPSVYLSSEIETALSKKYYCYRKSYKTIKPDVMLTTIFPHISGIIWRKGNTPVILVLDSNTGKKEMEKLKKYAHYISCVFCVEKTKEYVLQLGVPPFRINTNLNKETLTNAFEIALGIPNFFNYNKETAW